MLNKKIEYFITLAECLSFTQAAATHSVTQTAISQYIAALEDILSVDRDLWKAEAAGIRDFYQQFGDKLPKELAQELENLEARLNA